MGADATHPLRWRGADATHAFHGVWLIKPISSRAFACTLGIISKYSSEKSLSPALQWIVEQIAIINILIKNTA